MDQGEVVNGTSTANPAPPLPPAGGGPDALPSAQYLSVKLADAELLLCHAASSGVEVDAAVTGHVLAARRAESGARWTLQDAESLMSALTVLSAKLRPITAETLRLSGDDRRADRIIRFYRRVAISLVLIILPFSVATFATSAISSALHQDLITANALAVLLSNELEPVPATTEPAPVDPPGTRKGVALALEHGASQKEVIEHLQDFAATTRMIYARAGQLNLFIGRTVSDPFAGDPTDANKRHVALELDPGVADLPREAEKRIGAYQGVRYFAQNTDAMVSIFYGAWAACILPVLYALLGTCAYLLRSFEQQLRTKTLSDSDAHLARFVIAVISGAVIGLFNNINFGQLASVSPLAIAFVVGYAVDVFFAFLEGLIQTVNRSRPGAPTTAPPPATSAKAERAS